jgi:uncharacterized Ntn-hydrolase superfamily protein
MLIGDTGVGRPSRDCPTFSSSASTRERDLGVAVASKFFAVGSVVPWAEAGSGASHQASANTTFGPKGLAMMRTGKAAEEALKQLLASDKSELETRQVGIVDAQGRSATFTGKTCMSWAGGLKGKNWAAQGNILVSSATVEAMGKKFESTKGELAERLMAALEAGDAAGGDSRGRQSAALVVVRKAGGYRALNDRYIDLRVDDAEQPIVELRRLVSIALANAWMQHAYTLTGPASTTRRSPRSAGDRGRAPTRRSSSTTAPACWPGRGRRTRPSPSSARP